jgi:hypothetical protein
MRVALLDHNHNMDVPFISSGAMSRAHYALVRKVEAANSPQLADRYLLAEIESLKLRFEDPGLSLVRFPLLRIPRPSS